MIRKINLYAIKEYIEKEAKSLWQGKGVDMELVQKSIVSATQMIVKQCEIGFGDGIEFPIQYVIEATNHLEEAIRKRDDYLLADCLYYEWREIIIVYLELVEELEKNV